MAEYESGLGLIAADFLEVTPATEPMNNWLDQVIHINVPKSTQRVCVSLISWDMTLGTTSHREVGTIASSRFILTGYDYSGVPSSGVFKFKLQAVLQTTSDANHTGNWSGRFGLEFLCFG